MERVSPFSIPGWCSAAISKRFTVRQRLPISAISLEPKLFQTQVIYLGHVAPDKGKAMSRQGAESLLSQPVPRTPQSCSSDPGLTRFASLAQLADGSEEGNCCSGYLNASEPFSSRNGSSLCLTQPPSIAKSLPVSNAGGRISNLEAALEQEQRRHSRLMA